MPNITKDIKFQYAILVYEDSNGVQKRFDFEEWLHAMNQVPYEDRSKKVYTNLVRLDKCQEKEERDGLIGLRFLRLRDSNMPYKVPNQEEAQDLDIADDEFIGESLHIVYDTETRYFMIQVNRYSVGLNGLAAYINLTNTDSEKTVHFKPFHKNLDISKLSFGRYKCLEIGVANVGAISNTLMNSSLGSILNAAQDYGGQTIKIKISIGRARKQTLKRPPVENLIRELPGLTDVITSARLTYCEGDMEKGEELNLLDLVEKSVLSLQILERKALDFDYTIKTMKQEYMNKKAVLDRMLNIV